MTPAKPSAGAGKGSRPRPYSPSAYGAGWTRIFGSQKKAKGDRNARNRQKRKELPR